MLMLLSIEGLIEDVWIVLIEGVGKSAEVWLMRVLKVVCVGVRNTWKDE